MASTTYQLLALGRGWYRFSWPAHLDHADDVYAALLQVADLPGVQTALASVELPRNVLGLDLVQQLFTAARVTCTLTPSKAPPMWKPARLPFPHQTTGVQFMLQAQRGLLADDMGLGKTQQAIMWSESVRRHCGGRPVVLVVKRPLQQNWVRELLLAGAIKSEDAVCRIESRNHRHSSFRTGASYYLVNPEIVRDWWSRLYSVRACAAVLDEAHAYKDSRTNRSIGANMVTTAPHTLLLTGSPMPNRPAELWSLLNMLEPRAWGSPLAFRTRYCGAYKDTYGHRDTAPTNVEELRARMAHLYLRREVHEVAANLPTLSRQILEATWDEATLGADLERQHAELLQKNVRAIRDALVSGRVKEDVLPLINRLRTLTSQAKIDATVDYVKEATAQGESVVVFTWLRETANAIAKKVRGRVVHGELPQKKRDEVVDAFQREGGVIVATYATLSEGVTLTKARLVVLHDLDWVPKDIVQAERRVARIGQTRPCTAVWVTMQESIDELLVAALRSKVEHIAAVTGDFSLGLSETLDKVSSPETIEDELDRVFANWDAWREERRA